MSLEKSTFKNNQKDSISHFLNMFSFIKFKTFYIFLYNFFNPKENIIGPDTVTKFSFYLLKSFFIKLSPLPVNADKVTKFWDLVRNSYIKFVLVLYPWSVVSKLILITTLESLSEISPLVLDVFVFFLNLFKIYHTYLLKVHIWKIYEETKKIFELRSNRNRKYGSKIFLDNYHLLMSLYAVPVALMSIIITYPIIPYLLCGSTKLNLLYWYPFDPNRVDMFPIAYFWVTWTTLNSTTTLLAIDSMLYALMTIISMQFHDLKMDYMNVIVDGPNNEIMTRMKNLIERHNKLLDVSEELEKIYSMVFFLSFSISSLIMCFIAYELSSDSNDLASYAFLINYFWMMGAQTLLLCTFGQKLIDSCNSVSDGVYNCGWEDSDDNAFKKQLIFVLLRGQRTKKMTALGFADISLETFTKVLI